MNSVQEFQGVCPLCYKPIKGKDETRTVQTMDREETYHAFCLLDWIQKNSPNAADSPGVGATLLEEYKNLFISHSMQKRAEYMTINRDYWKGAGEHYRMHRERIGWSLARTSEQLGISPGRLKRFENGEPVKDAKLIAKCYILLILYCEKETELIYYRAYFEQAAVAQAEGWTG